MRVTVRVTVTGRARFDSATGTGARCVVGATATASSTTAGVVVVDGGAATSAGTGPATWTAGSSAAPAEVSAPPSSIVPARTEAASVASAPAETSRRLRAPSGPRPKPPPKVRCGSGRALRAVATSGAVGRSDGSVAVICRIVDASGSGRSAGITGLRCSRAIADSSAAPSNSRRPVAASSSRSPSA